MTLIKKPQKQWYYHQAKVINMNILQVKKYYLYLKVKHQKKLNLHIFFQKKQFDQAMEDKGRIQINSMLYRI